MTHKGDRPGAAVTMVIFLAFAIGLLLSAGAFGQSKKCYTPAMDMEDTKKRAERLSGKFWTKDIQGTDGNTIRYGYIPPSRAGFVVLFIKGCGHRASHVPLAWVRVLMGKDTWRSLFTTDT